jgi:hypothetical protein
MLILPEVIGWIREGHGCSKTNYPLTATEEVLEASSGSAVSTNKYSCCQNTIFCWIFQFLMACDTERMNKHSFVTRQTVTILSEEGGGGRSQ